MGANLSEILDDCIARIENGEAIETCLAEYQDIRTQLEPLLYMASSISLIPRVSPSDEFSRTSKARLMTRLRQMSVPSRTSERGRVILRRDGLATVWQTLWQPVIRARKLAISVTVALVLALGGSILLPGILDLISPPPAMASPCTLSILSGEVEFGKAGSDSWQPGIDGMTLTIGTDVRTAADAHAVLTFFEGSTIKLDPSTVVGIREVGHSDEESVTIVVEQLLGSTWSRVEKTGPGSYYKIQTPSATVMALGTLFATEVDDTGRTKVAATKGLVSVIAQGEEVHLTASYQTVVKAGAIPSTPEKVSPAKAELLIVADMPAVCSVRDPTGSSTGYLPSGLSFNQITGSESSLLSSGRQVISIAQPVSGEYVFILRYTAQETARFSIRSESEGTVVLEHSGELSGVEGGGWLVRINLNVDGDVLVSSAVVGIEPLGDVGPEKIVTTDLARERAVPIRASTPDSDAQDGPTDGQGDDEDVSNSVDQKDSYDDVRNADTGRDISDKNKNDSTTCADTDDDVGYDSADGDTSDAETSDSIGVDGASGDTGDKEPDGNDPSSRTPSRF